MRPDDFTFTISPDALALGLTGAAFILTGFTNRISDEDFEVYKNEEIVRLLASITSDSISADPIIVGYHDLHRVVGCSGKHNIASPEALLSLLLRTGRLPQINLLVDIYNLVSAKTRLSLGAHDISRITGNVTLKLTTGKEVFVPLGKQELCAVRPGEYAYVDDSDDILCRLETRQCDKSKVTVETKQCFVMVQGNRATCPDYIIQHTEKLITLVTRYCGGSVRMLYMP